MCQGSEHPKRPRMAPRRFRSYRRGVTPIDHVSKGTRISAASVGLTRSWKGFIGLLWTRFGLIGKERRASISESNHALHVRCFTRHQSSPLICGLSKSRRRASRWRSSTRNANRPFSSGTTAAASINTSRAAPSSVQRANLYGGDSKNGESNPSRLPRTAHCEHVLDHLPVQTGASHATGFAGSAEGASPRTSKKASCNLSPQAHDEISPLIAALPRQASNQSSRCRVAARQWASSNFHLILRKSFQHAEQFQESEHRTGPR